MSDIINILPDSVANQIAAGEVVDRPASAVKELLENALDAGATHIQLNVKDAGRTLIQVTDDGSGMSDSDARLCFERHATSKIHTADDLFGLHTMGFRGEALASIASIAQVEMKTRLHDAELGTCIEIEGSHVKAQQPCNCQPGTTIAVKNLFYNVPARRNFLKRDTVELSHIEEMFRRVALAHCDVAFSFYNNGRILYELKSDNLARRIANLFGHGQNERLYVLDTKTDIVKISGYVGKAEYAKKTRGEQYLFVNGRYIKHPMLSAAIEKAYADLIPERFYPSYCLLLEVSPDRIDVNIHPTKTEVKFIDEHALFSILHAATKKVLGQFSLATEFEFNPSTDVDLTPAPKGYVPMPPVIHYDPGYTPFRTTPADKATVGGSTFPGTRPTLPRPANSDRWETFFDKPTTNSDDVPTMQGDDVPTMDLALDTPRGNVANHCIQIQNRWIVSSLSSGMLVVDQQRAHERILFDRLVGRRHTATAQQLLFPVNCTFTPADGEIVAELLPDIRQYGFELAPLGTNTYVVTATPNDVKEDQVQHLFDQMVADYKNSMLQRDSNANNSLCLTLARQMAIKAGTPLRQEEMQQLIADLFSSQSPEISPSGKKTMAVLDLAATIG